MQHSVYLRIDQTFYSANWYLTEQGLQGNLRELVDSAGMAGMLCSFPESKGTLYGFMITLVEAPGRPMMWVVLNDLKVPTAYTLRPMSWSMQWQHMSQLTMAQYAQFMFDHLINTEIPSWKGYTMGARVAAMLDEVDLSFWARNISDKSTLFDWQDNLPGDSKDRRDVAIIGLLLTFNDGSQVVMNATHGRPTEVSTGILRSERVGEDNSVIEEIVFYPAENYQRLQ